MRAPLALCAVVVVASCGGGGGATRIEWASNADAICAKYERRLDSLGTADELPELARLLDEAVSLLVDEHRELSRLEVPEADRARTGQMLAYVEETIAAARRAAQAARRGDEQAVTVAIGESDSASSQARHVARDLGARTCAEP